MDYLLDHPEVADEFLNGYNSHRYDYEGNIWEVAGLTSDSVYLANVNDDTSLFVPLSCWNDFSKNAIMREDF